MLLWVLYWLVTAALAAVAYLAIGGFFLRRRKLGQTPRLAAALFLAACAGSTLTAGRHALGSSQVALAFWALSPVLFLLFFYLFSDWRFVPRNTRWLAILFGLSQIGQLSGGTSSSNAANHAANAPNFALMPQALLFAILLAGDAVQVAFLIIGVAPQVYARRRHLAESAPDAPVPWRMLGAAVAGGVALVGISAATFTQPFGNQMGFPLLAHSALYLITTLLPVPLAFAVLSVRPWDRQALTLRVAYYGALTLCLIAAYALTCAVVLVAAVPLQDHGSVQLAIVSAALVTAGLFRPLGRWLQPKVERWLFPAMHHARSVLTRVSGDVGSEIHLSELGERLMSAVRQALSPEAAVLWVRTAPSLSAQAVERLLPARSVAAAHAAAPTSTAALELQPRYSLDGRVPTPSTSAMLIARDDPFRATLPPSASALPVARLPVDSPAVHTLKASGTVLVWPLASDGELVGVLALGPKGDSLPYAFDECELLDDLARALAPALRVALVVHEQDAQVRARERAEQEMRTARRIQQTLLPREVPRLDGWQIDVYYEPAREVGGDFYDFIRFADGRLGIVLGDVTDKGVPAALVMATTRSMLRAAAQESTPPGAVLARVNELLCADLPENMFVTCFYGILDPASGSMRFANAGQDLPYLRGASAGVSEVHATGMPLGLMPGMTYEEHEVTLAAGDSILFYSDGLVEAHDAQREMFGFPRLAAYLGRAIPGEGPIAGLLGELAGFTGAEWEQEDDITLLALRRTSGKGS